MIDWKLLAEAGCGPNDIERGTPLGCNFLSREIVVNPSLQSEPNAAAMSCFESSRSTETF